MNLTEEIQRQKYIQLLRARRPRKAALPDSERARKFMTLKGRMQFGSTLREIAKTYETEKRRKKKAYILKKDQSRIYYFRWRRRQRRPMGRIRMIAWWMEK
jgi:hypothetical protein